MKRARFTEEQIIGILKEHQAGQDQVQIGTPVVYGIIHHFDGEAARNYRENIPGHPILDLSSEDETAILEIAEDF